MLARINHLLTVVVPSLGLNPLTDAQVLSPMNTGGLGTNALNQVREEGLWRHSVRVCEEERHKGFKPNKRIEQCKCRDMVCGWCVSDHCGPHFAAETALIPMTR